MQWRDFFSPVNNITAEQAKSLLNNTQRSSSLGTVRK